MLGILIMALWFIGFLIVFVGIFTGKLAIRIGFGLLILSVLLVLVT